LGIKPLPEALAIARDKDLDLVEVAPLANPPVCRIMDYNKFRYDEAQRAKESRRKSTNVSLKEMKYRLKIGPGDFDTKTRKVAGFLADGHKVKITIMFRGREVERPQYGKQILDRVADKVAIVGKVETVPRLDGRNMVMVLSPDKRAQAHAQAAARQSAAGLGDHDDSHDEPAESNGAAPPDSTTRQPTVAAIPQSAPTPEESTDAEDED
jgi:translation initiation factor IF-3